MSVICVKEMKMSRYLSVFSFLVFVLFVVSSHAKTFYEVVSQGYTNSDFPQDVIRTEKDLARYLEDPRFGEKLKGVKLGDDAIVAILSPEESKYPEQIIISEIKKDKNGNYKVYYEIYSPPFVSQESGDELKKPFIVLKINSPDIARKNIVFINRDLEDVVIVHNSLGAPPSYTNVLLQDGKALFLEYFPLDRGNSWTYKRKYSSGDTVVETYSVVSIADGWSIFDYFFGKYNLGFKIDGAGNLLVSSKDGISRFYTDEVVFEEKKAPFVVDAGKFDQLLVVTIPKKENGFWFKDVYAKGVGLIYHERTSGRGRVVYSLLKAHVRGKAIP